MEKRKFWLRLLNVDQGEWWTVRNLMMLQFLQGVGIAFFFTASFVTFLDEHEATELPWVMILSALLLWGTGYVYSKLEHRLPITVLTIAVTSFMLASALFFRIADHYSHGGILLYWMVAWFHVLYLLNNLQFWGVATLLFDLRQSKRLFGLISSGDIPAKLIGYFLALLAVKSLGTMNMLYASAVCMALSFPFLIAINRSGKLVVSHGHKEHDHGHENHPHGGNKLFALIRNFADNKFIRDIALISMLAFCCLLLIDYGFYAEVKHKAHDDKDLGTFIITLQIVIRLLALIAKMIFTGRVMSNMGLRQALLITPLTMLSLTGITMVILYMYDRENTALYMFGASFIVIDVCRTVFNSPSLITLMQPLPTHERLRAHNIVKGIMDPFAYLVTGIILLFLVSRYHEVPLFILCYIVLGMGAIWLLGIWLVNRQYLLILVKTITSRYFSQEEFSLKDENILQAIRKKIATGNELEVISILKMLNSKTDPMADDITISLLSHPSPQVKQETLKLITAPLSEEITATLTSLAENDEHQEIRDEAVKAFCKTGMLDRRLRQFAASEESPVRKSALSGMLLNQDRFIREMAEDEITALLGRGDRMDKLFAAGILQEVKDDYCHPQLHEIITEDDTQIQASGIRAIGRAASERSLRALVQVMPGHIKPALLALQAAGDNAVDLVGELLQDPSHDAWKDKLILLLGRVGGEKAQQQLVKLLHVNKHQATVIRALYRTRYKADEPTMRHMEQLARTYIIYGVELMHMQRTIRQNDQHSILRTSLDLEVQEIRDLLLCLFACMFDRVKMNQAKHGLESNINENVANAMEIIELTVRKDIGRYFNTMFESTSLEHRCDALRNLLKELDFTGVDDVIAKVLEAKPIQYQDWTKACSLYITRKYMHNIDPELIARYSQAENRMVRETARYAMVNV